VVGDVGAGVRAGREYAEAVGAGVREGGVGDLGGDVLTAEGRRGPGVDDVHHVALALVDDLCLEPLDACEEPPRLVQHVDVHRPQGDRAELPVKTRSPPMPRSESRGRRDGALAGDGGDLRPCGC